MDGENDVVHVDIITAKGLKEKITSEKIKNLWVINPFTSKRDKFPKKVKNHKFQHLWFFMQGLLTIFPLNGIGHTQN